MNLKNNFIVYWRYLFDKKNSKYIINNAFWWLKFAVLLGPHCTICPKSLARFYIVLHFKLLHKMGQDFFDMQYSACPPYRPSKQNAPFGRGPPYLHRGKLGSVTRGHSDQILTVRVKKEPTLFLNHK